MDLYEKTISEEYKYKGKTINLKVAEVQLPNGKVATREIVEHPGAVAVIPILDNGNVILVEQFRKALDEVILEFPAGKLHKNEELESCAIRELEEETGYRANNMEFLGKLAMAPGFADEIIYVYRATGLYKGKTNWDEDEFINIKNLSMDEIKSLIKEGKIYDAKTVAAMWMLSSK